MVNVDVVNTKNEKVKSLELSEQIFGAPIKSSLVHEVLTMQQACGRKGNAATKTRGLVSGSGRKPWRQKGTGRARVGSSRSPVWKGGGVVFGPLPRNYAYDIPKKKKIQAISGVLTSKVNDSSLIIIDKIELSSPKTKMLKEQLNVFGVSGKILLLGDCNDFNLVLASRNISNLKLVNAEGLNIFDLLNADKVLACESELLKFIEIKNLNKEN